MIGVACAQGAVSIVNAIAGGHGAALAVDLPTRAKVTVEETAGKWVALTNGKPAVSNLPQNAARRAIESLGRNPRSFSGRIETATSAPVGVGLKTSSSSSVAIALATLAAFGEDDCEQDKILGCSVSASLDSGASVTGAIDDASACLLGGAVFTDNRSNKIVSSIRLGEPLTVIIKVPRSGSRRSSVSVTEVRRFAELADSLFEQAKGGKVWKAMTLNGLLYCAVYGYPSSYSLQALEKGALGAGLSGTGPAVAAVFRDERRANDLGRLWSADGAAVIKTRTRDGGATVAH